MKKLGFIGILALSLFAGAALAADAQLTGITGSVLVNTGEKYQKASEGADLNIGDQVMVMENSEAVLTFPNGCTQTIKGSKIVKIGETECKAAVVADGGGAVFGNMTAVEVGAGAGIVIGGIAIVNNGGDGQPASP